MDAREKNPDIRYPNVMLIPDWLSTYRFPLPGFPLRSRTGFNITPFCYGWFLRHFTLIAVHILFPIARHAHNISLLFSPTTGCRTLGNKMNKITYMISPGTLYKPKLPFNKFPIFYKLNKKFYVRTIYLSPFSGHPDRGTVFFPTVSMSFRFWGLTITIMEYGFL